MAVEGTASHSHLLRGREDQQQKLLTILPYNATIFLMIVKVGEFTRNQIFNSRNPAEDQLDDIMY